ncbi:uncharacterized protein LOC121928691 isoform X2 [Sceloporus undulatus]|uniref:uncharacterized protein LOC121928691 isoform X2 n=1 Tax=Sceloporus undulatus TaxID=8520 RepID=UPI001C4BFE92|nr:uncharacterized protein LOC121928691 isoform X2 [Sceloporus undulatus]
MEVTKEEGEGREPRRWDGCAPALELRSRAELQIHPNKETVSKEGAANVQGRYFQKVQMHVSSLLASLFLPRPLPENSRRSRLGSGERSGLEEEEDRRRCLLLLPDHQHPARTLALLLSSRTAVFFFCKTLLTTARNNMESAA